MDLQHMLHQKVCKNPRIIRLGRIPSHKFLIVNFVDAYEITNGFKTTLERGYLNGDISDVREISSRTDGLITFLFIRWTYYISFTSVKLK
jgi:hypothetical protein